MAAQLKIIRDHVISTEEAMKREFANRYGGGTSAPGGPSGGAPVEGAKQGKDGNWYVRDPQRPGKYLQVN
jgi:hypothetical protein